MPSRNPETMSNYEFACHYVSPFAAIPPGEWPRLWAATQCGRLGNKYLALVVLDTAAHNGPGTALVLLQQAAGVQARVAHMTTEDLTPILCADPFQLAASIIEHRRNACLTGNDIGHLDRLVRIVREGYLKALPARRKAEQRLRNSLAPEDAFYSGGAVAPPVPEEPTDDGRAGFFPYAAVILIPLVAGFLLLSSTLGG